MCVCVYTCVHFGGFCNNYEKKQAAFREELCKQDIIKSTKANETRSYDKHALTMVQQSVS